MTANREAMRKLFRVEGGWNQLHLPAIFPDKPAPIVRRTAPGGREIVAARWGMPTPPAFRKGPIDRSVTSIRNANLPHWRAWMKPEFSLRIMVLLRPRGGGDQIELCAAACSITCLMTPAVWRSTVAASRRQSASPIIRCEMGAPGLIRI